ncbi:hypothetical protein ACFVAV_23330 [Nocardia sp. NPDC057663]|uniref:hypothetical protein n=1 Tax=Nocardia sp. NPDC057663 TaxID=3346201 RepID=UPI00366F4195
MTAPTVFPADALSRVGERFLAVCEVEDSGELSIMTRGDHGHASAHRRIAREYFGVPVVQVMTTGYVSESGEALALTTWLPKPGRVPVPRTVFVNVA